MIRREEIDKIIEGYDRSKIKIATICSHSALQLFYGARQEGFRTIGICEKKRKETYEAFPFGKPDKFIIVDNFKDILDEKYTELLRKENAIIIPHGSFVEYVGPENLENKFLVPIFGNRKTLEWERSREKQKEWLEKAGLVLPKEFKGPLEINKKVFIKLSGAKGGKGFFTVSSKEELKKKLAERINNGTIKKEDSNNITIQEFISGVRYYIHYFYSPLYKNGALAGEGRVELLSMDKRIEPIDESYRGLPKIPQEFFDYTVTGNQPIVIRESLLPELIKFGINVINTSIKLFPPGIVGPFCLETIYHPSKGFITFEISARIVAGTNLYPQGSQYSCYIFNEPMSSGRRIAREIKQGIIKGELRRIIF